MKSGGSIRLFGSDAAGVAGVALPSGCRVGQCESCAMRIVEGKSSGLVLTKANLTNATCQAVPLSELTIAP